MTDEIITVEGKMMREPARGPEWNPSTDATRTENLRALLDPSIAPLFSARHGRPDDWLVHESVRANIRASVNHLRRGSDVLEQLIQTKGLMVVGAEYSLETGVVDFFDDI